MVIITYIEPEGAEITADVALGLSVMEGAVRNGVSGIDAECGGACNCATCHVHIGPQWVAKTGARSEDEEAMLDLGAGVSEDSRLSCQIRVTDDLDGLIVRVAKRR